jgi:CO/xanthine dehydrogenase Mo-binding subunit
MRKATTVDSASTTCRERPSNGNSEVRYVGEPIAAVVAESRYLAEDAVDLVSVQYDQMVAVIDLPEGFAARPHRSRQQSRGPAAGGDRQC